MKENIAKIIINKTPAQVFDFAVNPANTAKWVKGVAKEEANETPTKLGTVYKRYGHDGSWAEFVTTAYEHGKVFELTKRDDNHHVRYTFAKSADNACELTSRVYVDSGEISDGFTLW